MEVVETLSQHRQALGQRLRELRESKGLSGSELARRLGWSQSRVSRIETARQSLTADDVRAITRMLGVSDDTTAELVATVSGLEREWTDYQTHLARGTVDRQAQVQQIEAGARTIRGFQPVLVPGLLQTPAYTRAMIETEGLVSDEDEIAAIVELRTERQRILDDPDKSFAFLLTESALWNRYGSAEAMRGQYEHIQAAAMRRNVRLGIIPRWARLTAIPSTDFTVYDDALVTISTMTSEIVLRLPADVSRYQRIFERLSSCAVAGKRADGVLDEITDTLL